MITASSDKTVHLEVADDEVIVIENGKAKIVKKADVKRMQTDERVNGGNGKLLLG
jgi:hypothetical protein